MRVGTAQSQQLAIDSLMDQQSAVMQAQEQISSGKRLNRPSDDPAAAAEAERVRSRQARIESEKRTVVQARQLLSGADTALGDATDLMQSARETLLAASNATASASDRSMYAVQLREIRAQLLSVANRGDGAGGFVFGGQGTTTAPIPESGAAFTAPAGSQHVGQQMQTPVSLDGRENFVAIPTPGGPESIFTRLDQAIATLSDPSTPGAAAGDAARAAVGAVDRAIDRFGVTRTMVGERLKALDAHESVLENNSIEAQTRLSDLVDVDFAKAVSTMTQGQTGLEAAMKSYAQIARMTLFQYM